MTIISWPTSWYGKSLVMRTGGVSWFPPTCPANKGKAVVTWIRHFLWLPLLTYALSVFCSDRLLLKTSNTASFSLLLILIGLTPKIWVSLVSVGGQIYLHTSLTRKLRRQQLTSVFCSKVTWVRLIFLTGWKKNYRKVLFIHSGHSFFLQSFVLNWLHTGGRSNKTQLDQFKIEMFRGEGNTPN